MAGEEPLERGGEGVVAGVDGVGERPGAGRHVAGQRGGVVVDDEEQRAGLPGVEAGDGLPGATPWRTTTARIGVAERGRDRDLGAGFDLEVVDERSEDPFELVELADGGVGARDAQLAFEGVGTGPGAGRVAFGGAPVLLRGAQGVLGGRGGDERVGAGQHRLAGVDDGELVAEPDRVGDEGLDDPFVGRGGELPFEAAALLGEERGEAPGRVRGAPRRGRPSRRALRRRAR